MYPPNIVKMSHQEKLRLMTRVVIETLNKADVHYWLSFGTLLGAIRNKDIIEYDEDADFTIPIEESPKVAAVLSKIVGLNNGIANAIYSWDGAFKLRHNGTRPPWVDIYPYKRYGDKIGHVQDCFGVPPYPYKFVAELIEVDFLGVKAKIPKMHHELLTHLYGDYMTPVKKSPYWS